MEALIAWVNLLVFIMNLVVTACAIQILLTTVVDLFTWVFTRIPTGTDKNGGWMT